ncbi:MAG: hypothetical protein MUF18_14245, partial [Fimbriiglobus sp.]|nr:hypothetical protein [Fimbriiglobus sp.]
PAYSPFADLHLIGSDVSDETPVYGQTVNARRRERRIHRGTRAHRNGQHGWFWIVAAVGGATLALTAIVSLAWYFGRT